MNMFTPGKIGRNILANRIIRSATNDHLADPDGMISGEEVSLYEILGTNHIGMIITGHFGIDERYRAAINQPLISDDRFIPSAASLAEAVHRHDGLIYGQISQAGLNAIGKPFDINSISAGEIEAVIGQFALGAKRLKLAGYDGVQIHLAHGYFLANVLDNTVNRRTDLYGGDPAKRFRLIREVLSAVRETCGEDFSMIVKLSSNNVGLTEYDEILRFYASELEKCGAEAIELSGCNFYDFPPERESYYLREALMLRQTVRIPLILVGGISDRKTIEEILSSGIDFVAMCRAFFCEPDYVTRLMNGAERSKCRRCGQCRTLYKTAYKNCVFQPESEALRRIFSPS